MLSFFSTQLLALEKIKKVTPADSIIPMLSGLLVILAVIFILAFIFKRFSHFNSNNNQIKIVETQIIGHKEKLMVVEIQQQQFLIGVTAQSINQLGELKEKIPSPLNSNVNVNKTNDKSPNAVLNQLPFGKIIAQFIQPTNSTSQVENKPIVSQSRESVS